MDDLILYDIDNVEHGFKKVSYDLKKNRNKFSHLKESTIFINNKPYPILTSSQWCNYIYYQNNWFRWNYYSYCSELYSAPNIGRRLTVLNKFFEEGELL